MGYAIYLTDVAMKEGKKETEKLSPIHHNKVALKNYVLGFRLLLSLVEKRRNKQKDDSNLKSATSLTSKLAAQPNLPPPCTPRKCILLYYLID